MNETDARFLRSARGGEALEAARGTRGEEALARRKEMGRRGFAPEEARAALAQDDLRVRAAGKTDLADRLLFTREALEQASPREVADERATRFATFAKVADLGAGIGLDSIALARAGRQVVAVERDPVRAALLRHNAEAAGWSSRVTVVEGDIRASPPDADAAFLDPDRRPGGIRRRDATEFEPAPQAWDALAERYRHLLVKLPPSWGPDPAGNSGTEWVSLDGEMKEARRGWGDLAIRTARRAMLLSKAGGMVALEGVGRPWPLPRAPQVGDVLLDPDPAVVVAGLVGDAAESVGAAPVHPRIAYLLSDRPAPWAASLRVEAVLAADPKEIRRTLEARGAGDLEIRARGVEDAPDVWRKRIGRLSGDRARRATIVLLRGPDDRYLSLLASPIEGGATGGGGGGMP